MRERQAHHPYGLDQIPFHGAAPIIVGAIGDARSSSATAYVVDQDINPAKGRDGGPDWPYFRPDVVEDRSGLVRDRNFLRKLRA